MTITEQRIRSILSRITGLEADISANTNLYRDLGLGSVYALQLMTELELEFQVAVPDEDFVEAASISKLAAMIDRIQARPRPAALQPDA
ncbi:MAG: acyl carrier protein [Bryobacteraceae bacterium]